MKTLRMRTEKKSGNEWHDNDFSFIFFLYRSRYSEKVIGLKYLHSSQKKKKKIRILNDSEINISQFQVRTER